MAWVSRGIKKCAIHPSGAVALGMISLASVAVACNKPGAADASLPARGIARFDHDLATSEPGVVKLNEMEAKLLKARDAPMSLVLVPEQQRGNLNLNKRVIREISV
jgi:hypothetical protein